MGRTRPTAAIAAILALLATLLLAVPASSQEAWSMTVTVTANGSGVADARVKAVALTADGTVDYDRTWAESVTGTDGTVTLAGLPAGTDYRVIAFPPAGDSLWPAGVLMHASAANSSPQRVASGTADVQAVLQAANVTGTVTFAEPVADANVEVSFGGDHHFNEFTRSDGSYRLYLPFGSGETYRLVANPPGPDTGWTSCPSEPVDVTAAATVDLTLRAEDADGNCPGGGDGGGAPGGITFGPVHPDGVVLGAGWISSGHFFGSHADATEGSFAQRVADLEATKHDRGSAAWLAAQAFVSARFTAAPAGVDAACLPDASDPYVARTGDANWDGFEYHRFTLQCHTDPWQLPAGDYTVEFTAHDDAGVPHVRDHSFTVAPSVVADATPSPEAWPVFTDGAFTPSITFSDALVAAPQGHHPSWMTVHSFQGGGGECQDVVVSTATLSCPELTGFGKGEWVVTVGTYFDNGDGTVQPVQAALRFWIGADVRIEPLGAETLQIGGTAQVTVVDPGASGPTLDVSIEGGAAPTGVTLDSAGGSTYRGTFEVVAGGAAAGQVEAAVGDRLEAVHHDASVDRSWFSTPLLVGAWPRCLTATDDECIVAFDLDGVAVPTGSLLAAEAVGVGGSVQVAFSYDGRHDLVTGSDLDHDSLLRLQLRTGAVEPVTAMTTGAVAAYSAVPAGDGPATVDVTVRPREFGYARTLPAEVADWALQGGVLLTLTELEDAGANDAARGSWIATNAQEFSTPSWDPTQSAFTFDVAAPHAIRTPTGVLSTTRGFVQARLTDAQLRQMGLEPSQVDEGSFETTVGGSPALLDVTRVDGGVLLDLRGFTYSTKRVVIRPATTDRGSVQQSPGPVRPRSGEVRRVGGHVGPGGSVRTAPASAFPTSAWPAILTVTSPGGGWVEIGEAHVAGAHQGYSLAGSSFEVTAPSGTADRPLRLRFEVHGSIVPPHRPLAVFRDGVRVRSCDDPASAVAAPDPCLASVSETSTGLVLDVSSSRASVWTVGALDASSLDLACPQGGSVASFDDVAADDPHARAIGCLAALELVRGLGDGTFGAELPVTRAQMASVLERFLGSSGLELPPGTAARFTDVTPGGHASAIGSLADAGVIRGVTADLFAPGRSVTRAQAAALVVRGYELLAGEDLPREGTPFTDVPASHPHAAVIDKLATAGFTTGTTGRSYRPDGPLTRGQLATIVARMLQRATAEELVD